MSPDLLRRAKIAFAPPRYLAPRATGIDISASGFKIAILAESPHGLELAHFLEVGLPVGVSEDGEVTDRPAVAKLLKEAAARLHVRSANASLPESKSYLFEARAAGASRGDWQIAVEQRLEELVPLPPAEAIFDIVPVGRQEGETVLAGVAYARRIVDGPLAVLDAAGVATRALESETFAIARALLPYGDPSTVLVVDIGKTTTKVSVVASRIPRLTTTVGIGGHAFTLAVEKHFGVSDEEAKRVKAEHGIVPAPGNEDYLATMLSTASAIRDEIGRRLEYWQGHAKKDGHEPVSRAILVGGNASVRGLPEYPEGTLKVPFATGNVFTNFAKREYWLPPIEYQESLAYATAIGLALREYAL